MESEISEPYFRRDVGWKSTGDAGGNNFHPVWSRYATHWILTYSFPSKAVISLHIYGFFLLTLKHHISIHNLLKAGSNSSLRFRGHDGCWVEFNPVSLSKGLWGSTVTWRMKDLPVMPTVKMTVSLQCYGPFFRFIERRCREGVHWCCG